MVTRAFKRVLPVVWLASLLACAGVDTHPDDLSAGEHRARAAQARQDAELEDAAARRTTTMIMEHGPDHEAMARALRDHAKEHEAAARELLSFQAQECAGLPADFAGQCPLIRVDGVEDTHDGVILWLHSAADVEASLRRIQCYLAYGRTQAFQGEPGCPFYVRGVHVVPVENKAALRLVASDETATATLQRLIHRSFSPNTGPQAGAKAAPSAPQR